MLEPSPKKNHRRWRALLASAFSVALVGAACGHHEGKLEPSTGGTSAGVENVGATAGEAASPADGPTLPAAGGAGGNAPDPIAGGGASPQAEACIYHLDLESAANGLPLIEAGQGGAASEAGQAGQGGGDAGQAGQAGQGGEAGQGGQSASPTIAKATNRLIGDYLVDGSGRALYVFGADWAGDCQVPPVTACEGDCLQSWPVFHGAPRMLGPGLDDAAFGSFLRADGLPQTTYYGWPLYYYANDAQAGDVTGHGSGVWGLARLILPNVVVRRVGMDRLLADGAGRTLYAFAKDTRGTASSAPASACTGACVATHPPFSPSYVGAISTLEPRDFTSFVRSDGTTQVAYKGAPLYYSRLDERPGAVSGAEEEGFTIVLK